MAIPLNVSLIDNAQDLDVIAVSGVNSPGLVTLSGFKRENKFDVKEGKGAFGSTTTYVGRPPAKGTLTFRAWTNDQFDAWNDFLPLFQYNPTKKSVTAVEVYHPLLADLEIHSVVATSVSAWENDGTLLWTRTIELLEYFPAPKVNATSTPSGSQTNDPNAQPGISSADLSALSQATADAKQAQSDAKDATKSTFG